MTQKMKKGLFKIIPTSVVALMVLSLVVLVWQGQKVENVKAVAPIPYSAVTGPTTSQITLTFGISVDDAGSTADWAVTSPVRAVSSVDHVNGTTSVLNLTVPLSTGDIPTITYTNNSNIFDTATSTIPPTTAPVFSTDGQDPVIVAVDLTDSNTITVTYSELVATPNPSVATNWRLYDDVGPSATTITGVSNLNGFGNASTTQTLTIADYTGGQMYLAYNPTTPNNARVTDISDANNNLAAIAPPGAPVDDAIAPEPISAVYLDTNNDGTIDEVDVLWSENITLNQFDLVDHVFSTGADFGDLTPDSATVTAGSTLRILVTPDYSLTTGSTIALTYTYKNLGTAGSVQDGVGNAAGFPIAITVDDAAAPVINARAYSDTFSDGSVDQLSLSLSEDVIWNGVDFGQFALIQNNLTGFSSVTSYLGSGTYALYLSTSPTTDLTGVSGLTEPTLQYTQSIDSTNRVKDLSGNDMVSEGLASAIDDWAGPVMLTARAEDADSNGTDDQVVVHFSENVNFDDLNGAADGFAALSLTDGCTIPANADYSGGGYNNTNDVTIAVTGCTANDTAITPTVTYSEPLDGFTHILDVSPQAVQVPEGATSISNVDSASPTFVSAIATSDTNIEITFSEPVTVLNGADFTSPLFDFTVLNAFSDPVDPTKVNLTVDSLANTGFTSTDLNIASDAVIDYTEINGIVGITGQNIADGQAPTVARYTFNTQLGVNPVFDSSFWYNYTGDTFEAEVEGSEPLAEVRVCIKSLTGVGSPACIPIAGDFDNANVGVNFISSVSAVGNIITFNTVDDFETIADRALTPMTGYSMNIWIKDAAGNISVNGETFDMVWNVNPRDMNGMEIINNDATTDWSTITDFTDVTGLNFTAKVCDESPLSCVSGTNIITLGSLTFTDSVNLTDENVITALQNFGSDIKVGGGDGSGAPIIGIDPAALAALNVQATLSVLVPSAVAPALILYDDASNVIASITAADVAAGQTDFVPDPLADNPHTMDVAWDGPTQMLTFTTDHFSFFGTDSTAPTASKPTSAAQTLKSLSVSTSTVQSTEAGNIYLVLNGTAATTQAQINTAVTAHNAFLGRGVAVAATPYTVTVAASLNDGVYDIVAVDNVGNVSSPVAGWLTVDNTAPTNQDTVFAASTSKTVNGSFVIVSSGDATNEVWAAPNGLSIFTDFVAGSTKRMATSGTALSMLSPSAVGTYRVYVIDAAGNVSAPSVAILTTTAASSGGGGFAPSVSNLPTGSIAINSGAAATNTRTVTINVTYTNATEIMYSENINLVGASFGPIQPSISFTLSDGEGVKTIYAFLKNAGGVSTKLSDTIEYKINATPAEVTPPAAVVPPAPSTALVLTDPTPAGPLPAQVSVGMLVKRADMTAVYFIDNDNRRHAFPNLMTYYSWFPDFSLVQTISAEIMSQLPLGSNVTMRPVSYFVKITTDPKVYAVESYGVLRWIPDEATAITLFGANWASRVADVSDAFFSNYQTGSALTSAAHPTGSLIQYQGEANVYFIENGMKSFVSTGVFVGNHFQNKFKSTGISTSITYTSGADMVITPVETLMKLR